MDERIDSAFSTGDDLLEDPGDCPPNGLTHLSNRLAQRSYLCAPILLATSIDFFYCNRNTTLGKQSVLVTVAQHRFVSGQISSMANQNPNLASISGLTNSEMPIVLPWRPSSPVRFGLCFHSDRANEEDPWAKESLFEQSSLKHISARFSSKDGGRKSSKSTSSSRSSHFEDHLSVGLAASVGCPVLGGAASGEYDKHVMEDKRVNEFLIGEDDLAA